MKTLYMIGGPMGVGKTTVSRELMHLLPRCAFLDGDWCWMMQPFTVTDETKEMVQQNIAALLNNFLRCSAFENVIFCWVMHEQAIIDAIMARLDLEGVRAQVFTLTAGEDALRRRIMGDVQAGVRTADVLDRALAYLPKYAAEDTVKIDVSDISATQAAEKIAAMC